MMDNSLVAEVVVRLDHYYMIYSSSCVGLRSPERSYTQVVSSDKAGLL